MSISKLSDRVRLLGASLKNLNPTAIYNKINEVIDAVNNMSGSPSAPTNVSYNDLNTAIANNKLTPGQKYIISDYRSVNFLNGWQTANNNPTPTDPNFNPQELYYGDIEPIIVQAESTNTLSPIAYSTIYPNDILEYQAYTNKIGLDLGIQNGYTLPDSSTVSGFDLQWDGTNVYFDMPSGYPALFGHYFYIDATFNDPTYGIPDHVIIDSGVAAGGSPTTYNSLTTTTLTGSGQGLMVSIIDNGDSTYSLIDLPYYYGSNYALGDTVLVLGSQVGGVDGVNDVVLSIDGIDTYYWQSGNFEPLTPGECVCQYPYTSNDPILDYPKTMSRIKVVNNGTKVLLLDLTQTDVTNYIADSLYVESIYALGDAYGWVTKRIDTERNITAPFDFRARKYRRFEIEIFGGVNILSFSAPGTTASDNTYYITPNVLTGNGTGLQVKVVVSGGVTTQVIVTVVGANYKNGDTLKIYGSSVGGVNGVDDIDITIDNVNSNIDYYGIGDNPFVSGVPRPTTGNYKDFKCFGDEGYDAYDIEWNDVGGPDVNWYNGYSDNFVALGYFYNNKLNSYSYNNTVNNGFNGNNIGYYFNNNIIGNSFSSNTIKSFCSYNTIGNTCYNNDIGYNFNGNSIYYYFVNNTIGNDFTQNKINSSFYINTINSNFYNNNQTGSYFIFNTIVSDVQSNFFSSNFQFNNIKFPISNTDFTTATHVNNDYSCDIFRNSASGIRLSYVDGTDTVIYTNINA